MRFTILEGLYVDVELAFSPIDIPVREDVLTCEAIHVMRFAMILHILAQLRDVHGRPRDRLCIDQTCQVIVKPVDNSANSCG